MLRRLSPRAELIVINLICFGPFVFLSARDALRGETILLYDDRRLYTFALIEIVCGTAAILILRARGWKLRDFGLGFSMPLTIAGLILFLVTNVFLASMYQLLKLVTHLDPATMTTPVVKTTWPAVLLMMLIDSLYEETFEVAYNVRATEANGAAFGVTLSALVRLACHLYQGPVAPVTILPLGIIFALVYWRWKRVWPLAVAHAAALYFGLSVQT